MFEKSEFEVTDSSDIIIVQGIESDCYEFYREYKNGEVENYHQDYESPYPSFFDWCKSHYKYEYKKGYCNWCLFPVFGNENAKTVERTRDRKLLATINIEWGDITDEEKKEYLKLISAAAYYKTKLYLLKETEELEEKKEKGYDEHDIYTAFDGDRDSMNEFLGNH
jgi:hypothetical protein